MGRLPLRTWLAVALAIVALVPLGLFGGFAIVQLSISTGTTQDEALLGLARLAASEAGRAETFDTTTARTLADATGRNVTLLSVAGAPLAASDAANTATFPPGWTPSRPAEVARANGRATAIAAVTDRSGTVVGAVAVSQRAEGPSEIAPALVVALALAALWALALGYLLARRLMRPLVEISDTLDLLQSGDAAPLLPDMGEDELGRLAQSHNRLSAALAARNRSLRLVLEAVARLSPRSGVGAVVTTAEQAATHAFAFVETQVEPGPPDDSAVDEDEHVPGEAYRVRAPLVVGEDRIGTLVATLPPAREWAAADQDLLSIFANQLAAAIRSAELYAETDSLSELKSEFLRGVSHNLQTPLTSIRAIAERLEAERPEPRLGIIVEQSERLSRLVSQLLTVSRLETGTLRPRLDVFAVAPLVRRTWESLGRDASALALEDRASGWLAAADRDWAEQVVWAVLDNALKYGGDGPIDVRVEVEEGAAAAATPGVAAPHASAGMAPGAAQDIVGSATGTNAPAAPTGGALAARIAAARAAGGDHGGPAGTGEPAPSSAAAPVAGSSAVPGHVPAAAPRIVTSVRDHGAGIAPEDRERVFERFVRIGDVGEGTGLGLHVARGLARAMGGDLGVGATSGAGTTLVFSLPGERIEDG